MGVRGIPARVRDRASLGSILSSITPARLKGIFADADGGWIGRQIELAHDLRERDGHLRSLLQVRKLAVTGLEWVVTPGDESDASQQVATDTRAWWERLGPRNVIGRLHDAVYQQYAVEEVLWDTAAEWTPLASVEVDARRLVWPQIDRQDAGPTRSTQYSALSTDSVVRPALMRESWSLTDVEELTAGKYVCFACDVDRHRPGRGAMVRALAAIWMFKWFATVDWSTLVEQFGQPWVIVKYVPGMSPEELSTLMETIETAQARRVLAVPTTASVETTTGTAHTASPLQKDFIKFCEDTQSKVVLGNVTTTDAAQGNESVSSPTHAKVTRLIRDADALGVGDVISGQLFAAYFAFNQQRWRPEAKPARLTPTLGEPTDPQKRTPVYESAARLGLKVNSDQLYRELGIEKPEGVDEVLELKLAAGPAVPVGGVGDPLATLMGTGNREQGTG